MNWVQLTDNEREKPYFQNLNRFVDEEYKTTTCYPPYDQIFNALNITPLDTIKCVIIGQDPYHEPDEAMGLAFSVNKDIKIPPSLKNIYKEIHDELGCYIPDNGDLTPWAKQGVLLLNSILTVRAHKPASHTNKGWETYTDTILKTINNQTRPIVYMLWGRFAKSKQIFLNNPNHLVLTSAHPSPFSANYGFFGCGHFRKCNEFLIKNNVEPIDWQIKNVKQSCQTENKTKTEYKKSNQSTIYEQFDIPVI